MKTITFFLLLASCSLMFSEQPRVINGQVMRSLPIPGIDGGLSVDFSLLQSEGGSADANFSYDHPKLKGSFTLEFTGSFGCESGCMFSGNFTKWNKPELTIFGDCMLLSGELTGMFSTNGIYYDSVPALYSQVFCGKDGLGRYAAGDFTVNLPAQNEAKYENWTGEWE